MTLDRARRTRILQEAVSAVESDLAAVLATPMRPQERRQRAAALVHRACEIVYEQAFGREADLVSALNTSQTAVRKLQAQKVDLLSAIDALEERLDQLVQLRQS